MSQRLHVVLVDEKTNQRQEIDLTALLSKFLTPYVVSAPEAPRKRAPRKPRQQKPALTGNAAVRAWAASRGIQVAPRGKIPAGVTAKYETAMARRKKS
ncbi:histone-like nucleoid-structuring protein Lsr2 [Streptomyces sp. NPDC058440]|uniref:Lsr2 family DNA-binding protein n=1 Tax=Streptomyces sp. NPDC058440 TaxID=3346501 RepID=UPI00365624C5